MATESPIDKTLEALLRTVYDDDDFVEGVIGEAANEENRSVIVDFIEKAHEVGDELRSDDLLMLAIYLADNGPIRRG